MKSVLLKIQAFTINDNDGVSDVGLFYLHAVVVIFY